MTPLPDDLESWLQYQRSLNPQQMSLGLERLRPVARRMNLRAGSTPLISVAGTNGKGSTVALLEALARCHGLSSASYTSPWLLRYNESVRIDGEPVADDVLIEAFARVEKARSDVPLTEFECRTLAAAHIAFAQQVDVVVLEVGLGGRLDAVNLFDATVAIVSSVALDHQQWLGDSRELIAIEKAGIARPKAVLISAEAKSNDLLEPLARAVGALPCLAQRDYRFAAVSSESGDGAEYWWYQGKGLVFDSLPLPALGGQHQIANAAAAITALSLFGDVQMDSGNCARALREVRMMGRVQRLGDRPLRFVDVAHNPHAAAALAQWIQQQGAGPVSALCAMYADKDLFATVHALRDVVHTWHVASLPPPRGASAELLADAARRALEMRPLTAHESIAQGWRAACGDAAQSGFALGFGSFETVSAILRLESMVNRLDT